MPRGVAQVEHPLRGPALPAGTATHTTAGVSVMKAIHTETIGDLTINLYADPDPVNPREWDCLGVMHCRHRRYNLGDKGAPSPEAAADSGDPLLLAIALYLYDHSKITISTKPFSCPWDSGQVGWIYLTVKRAKKELGEEALAPEGKIKLGQILEQEVLTYDQFLRGACYGYTIERDGQHIDSLWGVYQNERPDDPEGYLLSEARAAAARVEPITACYI